MRKKIIKIQNDHPLVLKISELIENGRRQASVAVNLSMVYTYFEIGRMIVEDEQRGEKRAEYGKDILKYLGIKLTENFGKGFSERNLRNMRQFYQVYSDRTIWQKPSAKLRIESKKAAPIRQKPSSESPRFTLGWSHYLVLMRIENPDERRFYEIEAQAQHWSEPHLKRQFHSSLYERLALSRNKQEVLKLAHKGHSVEKATDFLKNPLTLEFLGLQENSAYSENDLETAIISKLQLFLLELGKGFLFETRQKRFTFDNQHFFVDLVFYNRLLQCYVLIDLKTDKLLHQDLGQMQMYVNYFDRYEKKEFEKPTIGILLCKKKNDALVELTLPKNSNIYASEYSLYLPDKTLLQRKLAEWIAEFEREKEMRMRLAGLKNE
jgi:predicted nuclease of restriction endonuclease-like (RecB) superfamily